MYDTRHDLPPATHAEVTALLADADAADLFTGRARATDKPSFLEAHQHATH
jgi:hypothetical protein